MFLVTGGSGGVVKTKAGVSLGFGHRHSCACLNSPEIRARLAARRELKLLIKPENKDEKMFS